MEGRIRRIRLQTLAGEITSRVSVESSSVSGSSAKGFCSVPLPKYFSIGLSWDMTREGCDLDLALGVFGVHGNYLGIVDGYENPSFAEGAILHFGNDTSGGVEGKKKGPTGDNECILVDMSRLPETVGNLAIVVSVNGEISQSSLKNASIRILELESIHVEGTTQNQAPVESTIMPNNEPVEEVEEIEVVTQPKERANLLLSLSGMKSRLPPKRAPPSIPSQPPRRPPPPPPRRPPPPPTDSPLPARPKGTARISGSPSASLPPENPEGPPPSHPPPTYASLSTVQPPSYDTATIQPPSYEALENQPLWLCNLNEAWEEGSEVFIAAKCTLYSEQQWRFHVIEASTDFDMEYDLQSIMEDYVKISCWYANSVTKPFPLHLSSFGNFHLNEAKIKVMAYDRFAIPRGEVSWPVHIEGGCIKLEPLLTLSSLSNSMSTPIRELARESTSSPKLSHFSSSSSSLSSLPSKSSLSPIGLQQLSLAHVKERPDNVCTFAILLSSEIDLASVLLRTKTLDNRPFEFISFDTSKEQLIAIITRMDLTRNTTPDWKLVCWGTSIDKFHSNILNGSPASLQVQVSSWTLREKVGQIALNEIYFEVLFGSQKKKTSKQGWSNVTLWGDILSFPIDSNWSPFVTIKCYNRTSGISSNKIFLGQVKINLDQVHLPLARQEFTLAPEEPEDLLPALCLITVNLDVEKIK